MTLGVYTVPSDSKKAGADDAKCSGSGTNGLQKDFESEVNSFLGSDDVKSLGYHIEMGQRGYVSRSTAQELANNGNKVFLQQIRFFGWGLGWEISRITRDNHRGLLSGSDLTSDSSFNKLARDWGFQILNVTIGGSLALSYLAPSGSHVKRSSDVDDLSYDEEALSSSSSASSGSQESISAAMYFFANQFNSVVDMAQSNMLRGIRALANDEALWNYVKKAVNASLRTCASDPDGNFIAWYPDYYGKYGLTPKTEIDLVELQDLTITQSDKEFYSHVFCPGVDLTGTQMDMLWTQGVVAIETDEAATLASEAALELASDDYEKKDDDKAKEAREELVADSVAPILEKMISYPEEDAWKYTPAELYRRYGARPAKTQSLPNFAGGQLIEDKNENIEAENKTRKSNKTENDESSDATDDGATPEHILPYLYALYEFMYHWANQYQAKIQVTFMPEVMPGSRIRVNLPSDKHIEFYVQSVTHNMSYTSGFTTNLGCICPVGNLVSGMVKASD